MSLLALADVKPHLKIDVNTDDVVLQAKLDAAEAFVTRALGGSGGLASSTVTETVYGLGTIPVTKTPMVTLTSVTGERMGALTIGDLAVDKRAGVIRPLANTWAIIADYYTIVYTTGYASAADVPADLVEVVRLMTQHFYETQRGPVRRPAGGPLPEDSAYARAMQILAGIQTGSFA